MATSTSLKEHRIAVSSSISNFKEKLLKKYGQEYKWWRDLCKPCIFFGLYRPKDFLKFMFHRGERIMFWCGADIYQTGWLMKIIRKFSARHICENELEAEVLMMALGGMMPEIRPQFFGDVNKYQVSFKPRKTPHVWMCSHEGNGAEIQAGLDIIESIAFSFPEITFHVYGLKRKTNNSNIIYHGFVLEERMDEEIKNYQCGLRLHRWDGFSEVTAKSILLGQYPITMIPYNGGIGCGAQYKEFMRLLYELKDKTEPNPGAEIWKKKLTESL